MQGVLPLLAILIINALRSDAGCSFRCTRAEIATNTPHCTVYDLVPGTVCSVSGSQSLVQRISKVFLTVELGCQHNVVEIYSFLPPGKLEIVFSRTHSCITTLILHNDLIRISADAFQHLPNLKVLILSETALDRFPTFTTANPLLTYLSLDNFTLDTLPATPLPRGCVSDLLNLETLSIYPAFKGILIDSNTLANLPALASLDLSNVSIADNVLEDLNNLVNLTLHYTDITDVSILAYLPNPHLIRVLDFDFNRINSIKGISRCTGLLLLGLYTNEINCISRSNFTGLSQLTFLNLPGNYIDVIFEDAFRELPSLEILNLDENPLTTISPRTLEYLPNFQFLRLPPMHCDCNLQFISILHERSDLTIRGYCGSPIEFSGYHVYDRSFSLNCTSPYEYSCFDKNRDPCNDGSTCRDTTEGFECVCEGENRVYSRAHGGKCFDIDGVITTIAGCQNGASINGDFNVECIKRQP